MLIYQNRKKIVNKKVLIAVDVNDQHVELFKEAANGKCDFVIKPMAELTEDDVAKVQAIIGNVSPDLVKKASKLEFLQLNSEASCISVGKSTSL